MKGNWGRGIGRFIGEAPMVRGDGHLIGTGCWGGNGLAGRGICGWFGGDFEDC